MDKKTLSIIRSDPLIYNYLRDDSTKYIYLLRDPNYIKEIKRLAKIKYKQRGIDKLERLSNNIELIKTFLDVIE